MAIFKSDEDAIRFELRKLWHDIMHREFVDSDELNRMVRVWMIAGAEAAITTTMDSSEGAMRQWQMQKLLDAQGRPGQPATVAASNEVFPKRELLEQYPQLVEQLAHDKRLLQQYPELFAAHARDKVSAGETDGKAASRSS